MVDESDLPDVLGRVLAPAQANILTANGNNDRNSANVQEYQLSPFIVNEDGFGKLGSYELDGQSYTQPLYASGIVIPRCGHS